jgi:osmotically-inducible protein OsmY
MSRTACRIFLLALIMAGDLEGCAALNDKCDSKDQAADMVATGCSRDAQITAAARAELSQHADLNASGPISVRTRNGVVYLSGLVATELQKEDAESLVAQMDNVKRVINNIAVSNSVP